MMTSEELFWQFIFGVRKLRLAYRPFQAIFAESCNNDSRRGLGANSATAWSQSEKNRLREETANCLRVYKDVSKRLKPLLSLPGRKFHMEKGFFIALPYAYFRHWVLPLLVSGTDLHLTLMTRTRLSELFAHVDLAHQRGVLATAEQGRSTMSERDDWCRQSRYWANGRRCLPKWIQNLKDTKAKSRGGKKLAAGAPRREAGAGEKGKSRGNDKGKGNAWEASSSSAEGF